MSRHFVAVAFGAAIAGGLAVYVLMGHGRPKRPIRVRSISDNATKKALCERALQLAEDAVAAGNHPFAAILYRTATGETIVECVNQVNQEQDLTAHAEIVAIREAGRVLDLRPGQTLEGYSMLVVADPCPMCMGALLWAKLDALDFLFHRDDVEKYETPNLGRLYAPRFRNKGELYRQVACCTSLPLGFYRELQERALAVYRKWSIV